MRATQGKEDNGAAGKTRAEEPYHVSEMLSFQRRLIHAFGLTDDFISGIGSEGDMALFNGELVLMKNLRRCAYCWAWLRVYEDCLVQECKCRLK